jgi:glycine/D-amino acid oxidase-like deaminating enzyme
MHRRTLLQLFAGVAVAGLPAAAQPRGRRIVIAGAGIVGAHVAYQLAKRGAAVVVVERGSPGNGATSKSFAWINATFSKRPRAYYELNRLGMLGWRHLDRELELPVRWGGSIEWYAGAKEGDALREAVRSHQAWGYPASVIELPRLKTLEPHVMFGSVAAASYSEDEGHVDPVGATEVLLRRAQALGAVLHARTTITGLDLQGGQLRAVRTTGGDLPADVLVIACGTDTSRVAAMADIRVPLKDSPGVLVHTTPQPAVLSRVVLAPGAHMKQKPDGRIVTGVGFGGTPTTDSSREAGERFLRTDAATILPALREASLDTVTLGWRPLPQDEFPIVGFAPNRRDVYITVMHSGVTLSPFVGRAAAVEILDNVDVEPLASFRLSRFAN